MTGGELLALADKVSGLTHSSNAVDVLVEIALFRPGTAYSTARSNAAGTKVIYTDRAGNNVTCWAEDWTAARRRTSTAAALKALTTPINTVEEGGQAA